MFFNEKIFTKRKDGNFELRINNDLRFIYYPPAIEKKNSTFLDKVTYKLPTTLAVISNKNHLVEKDLRGEIEKYLSENNIEKILRFFTNENLIKDISYEKNY